MKIDDGWNDNYDGNIDEIHDKNYKKKHTHTNIMTFQYKCPKVNVLSNKLWWFPTSIMCHIFTKLNVLCFYE